MGICRDSIHKRRLTGGKKKKWRKKRKYELGRQPSNTKIGIKRISMIRVRGGNIKKRALSLEAGNFSYLSLNVTRKTKIISVVYNSTNNELVRTNTLVKGSIIQIEPGPFREVFQKIFNTTTSNNYLSKSIPLLISFLKKVVRWNQGSIRTIFH